LQDKDTAGATFQLSLSAIKVQFSPSSVLVFCVLVLAPEPCPAAVLSAVVRTLMSMGLAVPWHSWERWLVAQA